ncbi:hypothetical protein BOTBODRAFT_28145 [Botryobasidium botryosum FD-172 SS1]|uniref:DUF6535 domain-containing protein n=1 Tax=Botryobasidium botryosum (strain FD-172 SS1) TaxID=930990 RepID=A0A067N604_BOTB1|nr:hypothetical protein BOTBODRAFT_28145 [Botryobasidium botryosum FD-172 SS1]
MSARSDRKFQSPPLPIDVEAQDPTEEGDELASNHRIRASLKFPQVFPHRFPGVGSPAPDAANASKVTDEEANNLKEGVKLGAEQFKLKDDDEPLYEDTPNSKFWSKYTKLAQERDKGLIQGWDKSMDIMLLFAALFSAIVTAFLIESYQGLSENPADTTNALLWQILINQGLGNSQLPNRVQSTSFKPPSDVVVVNCLWFASLIISLGATVATVLAKQ